MIVWCGRCDTRTVDITTDDLFAIRWFGHTAERPWCEWCVIWAVIQWPRIGIGVPMATKREMRDADTCAMGDPELVCPHGVRTSRFCMDCDTERFVALFDHGEPLPPDTNHGGDRIPGRYA